MQIGSTKGSSINDVTSEGMGGGVQKLVIWGDFQGMTGVTRGGRGVKKLENWGDVIYG